MKVTGFTIARNVVQYDYPIKEAILSILPLCDEFIVAVGKSTDNSLEFVRGIDSPKIKIIETIWDDSLNEGGHVLAAETNKVLDVVSNDTDWVFYIQSDEILHEEDIPIVRKVMMDNLYNQAVDGLLFNYKHFYGSYDYVADSRKWYKREARIIRKRIDIRSFRDAQGFRKNGNEKISVADTEATIYHYGWVKHPDKMMAKIQGVARNWTFESSLGKGSLSTDSFDYSKIDSLRKFVGTHPAVIQERINQKNWTFEHDISQKRYTQFRYRLLMKFEEWTGYRVGEFRNFKLIKKVDS